MEVIPIASLAPDSSPPADKCIRAVVTLLWPYSSSTKQCALLLAEPDFRLRRKKGQVRVRFTGHSALEVAKGHVGIGDEVLLELHGASWVEASDNVSTPGRSVDGELIFRGELGLSVSKSASGQETGSRIHVNGTNPSPEEETGQRQVYESGTASTPARATPFMRSSVGGADVVPIYSSPAFVRRLRLSGEPNVWDIFKDVDEELEHEQQPRKKQKIGFGDVGRWKLVDRSPSPEHEAMEIDTPTTEQPKCTTEATRTGQSVYENASTIREITSTTSEVPPPPKVLDFQDVTGTFVMPPPPLPRLRMPQGQIFPHESDDESHETDGPSTPTLQPVPSSALPLPSPFPTGAAQTHFRRLGKVEAPDRTTVVDPKTETFVEPPLAGRDAEKVERDGHAPLNLLNESALHQSVHVSSREHTPDGPMSQLHTREPILEVAASLASTASLEPRIGDDHASQDLAESRHHSYEVSQPEYLSDTEEDEDMYDDDIRRATAAPAHGAMDATDGREVLSASGNDEDDTRSQPKESDAEEVIEAMGQEPPDDDSASEEASREHDGQDDSGVIERSRTNEQNGLQQEQRTYAPEVQAPQATVVEESPVQRSQEVPSQILEKVVQPTEQTSPAARLPTNAELSQTLGARLPNQKSTVEPPKTPASRGQLSLFGFDGAVDTPKAPRSTPQSEKERIMAKTYSSLFGFAAPASPEPPKQIQTPTPAANMFLGHWPQIAKDESEAAVAPPDQSTAEAEIGSKPQDRASREATAESENAVDSGPSDLELLGATLGEAEDPDDVIPDDILEASDASAETGNFVQVADVDDGSLLTAVRADEMQDPPHSSEEYFQPPASDVAHESAPSDIRGASGEVEEHLKVTGAGRSPHIADIEMTDDPVPDGASINRELGEAIAPTTSQLPTVAEADGVPSTAQKVVVIDLGSSDIEEDAAQEVPEPAQPRANDHEALSSLRQPAQQTEESMIGNVSLDTGDMQQPWGPETTQGSTGSALQSDMLDTTQPTLDGSEIATPVGQDEMTIPETLQEASLWTEPGHRSFLEEQMPDQTVQLPLTQPNAGAFGNQLNFFSFQSATSVATDTSDNVPTTAITSSGERNETLDVPRGSQQAPFELESSSRVVAPAQPKDHDMGEAEHPTHRENNISVGAADAAAGPVAVEHGQRSPHVAIDPDLERSEATSLVRESEDAAMQSSSGPHDHGNSAVEASFDEAKDQASQGDRMETLPVPAVSPQHSTYANLPMSPQASQERTQSQYFETQIPLSRAALPTPQLTELGSSKQDGLQTLVDEPVDEAARAEPSTLRRTTRRQAHVAEIEPSNPAGATSRKRPQQRSTRGVPSEESIESTAEKSPAVKRSSRSVRVEQKEAAKPSVRRSSRISQTESQTSEDTNATRQRLDVLQNSSVESGNTLTKQAHHQSTMPSTPGSPRKTPVRRSARKTQAHREDHEDHAEQEADGVAVQSASERLSPPTSSGKARFEPDKKEKADLLDSVETEMRETRSKKTPARKSFTSRLGSVPEVISNWFSPRRSSRLETEEAKLAPETKIEQAVEVERTSSNGLSTSLSYFTPLSNIEQKLNAGSQSFTQNTVDVFAVVTDETKAPERAKSGPRDYYTVFKITDQSVTDTGEAVRVEVFRPWKATLPVAQPGDVILLRDFVVKSRKRQAYLLSNDSSAWCVWREGDAETSPRAKSGRRTASFSGMREEIKGPPVELGDEERKRAAELKEWWQGQAKAREAVVQDEAEMKTGKTRSGRV